MSFGGNTHDINVGRTERLLTSFAGLGLAAPLLWRRSKWTSASAVAGVVLLYRGITGSCGLYRSLGISTAGMNTAKVEADVVRRSITIGKPAAEVYALWRNPTTFQAIAKGVVKTTSLDANRTQWQVDLPAGKVFAWETEVVESQEGQFFHWRSVPGSSFKNEGRLRLSEAPQGRGTEVNLEVTFDTTGLIGGSLLQTAVTTFSIVPKTVVLKLLHNLKSLAETGEVPTLDRNPSGRAKASRTEGDWV